MLLKVTLFIVIGLFLDYSVASSTTELRKTLRSKDLKISDEEFSTRPRLNHHSAPCTPGKRYKVNCNECRCSENRNLICDNMLCIDHLTTRRIEAKKLSGKNCTKSNNKNCILCNCRQGKTECEVIEPCSSVEELKKLSHGSEHFQRSTLVIEKECVPNVVYT